MEICSTIFHLKHENWCLYDNSLYSMCERIAKLNREALGKIKNTNKNDRRSCPSFEIRSINNEAKVNQSTTKRRKTEL